MFFPFFTLFFLFQTQKFFAQEPVYVPLLAYWNKGEVFKYEVTEGKVNYKNDGQADSTSRKTLKKLTVIDSTSKGYTIRVSGAHDFAWESIGIPKTDLAGFLDKYNQLELEYDIDSNGAFVDFRNLDMMRQAFKEMLQLVFKEKKMLREMEGLIQMIATEDYMRRKVFMAYPLLHEFFGYQFAVDSVVVLEEEFPNFANPDTPFVMPVDLQMLQEEDWEGLAVLKKWYEFDKETCRIMFEGVMRQLPDGQQMIKETKDMGMTISCNTDYILDPDNGTVHALYYAHKIFVDGKLVGKEFIEMELVE